ncbi:MAG: helix-turn-helix domain-containing protein [Acidimicrobiia bacterium]
MRTLYAWRYRGEGPVGFRAGKHLRYRRCDIQRWIEQQIDTGASAFRVTGTT